jgi:tetratricopeptide (TPR) repeat protein
MVDGFASEFESTNISVGIAPSSDDFAAVLLARSANQCQVIAAGLGNPSQRSSGLGLFRLARGRDPETVWEVYSGHGSERPQTLTIHAPGTPTNCEPAGAPFIGRDDELELLDLHLRRSKAVSIVGASGTGKTALASRYGLQNADQYPDGVFLIRAVGGLEGICYRLARLLLFDVDPASAPSSVIWPSLADKRLLIILDDCDGSQTALSEFIRALSASSPASRVVATHGSRNLVQTPDAIGLDGLEYPEEDEGLTSEVVVRFPAVQLFLERSEWGRAPSDSEALEIARLCRHLKGNPLAVQIAASQSRELGLSTVACRYLEGIPNEQLAAGPEGAAEQATRWAYMMLDDRAKRALRFLSMFQSPWTRDVAERLAGSGFDSALPALCEAGVVSVGGDPVEGITYRLPDAVASFARRQVEERGEADEAAAAHFEAIVGLAEQAGEHLTGGDQMGWLDRLEGHEPDISAAAIWILSRRCPTQTARMMVAFGPFWQRRGPHWHAAALAGVYAEQIEPIADATGVRALNFAGSLLTMVGKLDEAAAAHCRARELAAKIGDELLEAASIGNEAIVRHHLGQTDEALTLARRAVEILRTCSNARYLAACLNNLGAIQKEAGDLAGASVSLTESAKLLEEVGDVWAASKVTGNIAEMYLHAGKKDEAIPLFASCLRVAHENRDPALCAACLRGLAAALSESNGEFVPILLGAAETILHDAGMAGSSKTTRQTLELTERIESRIGPDRFGSLWAAGSSMGLPSLIELICDEISKKVT